MFIYRRQKMRNINLNLKIQLFITRRCYGCETNLTCFIERLHNDLLHRSMHLTPINYVRDNHFFPMYWHCDFDRHFDKYRIIQYDRTEKFRKNLLKV